ncbi:probable pectin methylesterase CGR3 isoform X1 [Salvia hispanica]|uniref:probable pectin methylesterase CGR3 isoform X1 n=2 Tax=Salvia hispanica TaxID=49212 RepID=UPI0020093296|nr:probable pectin methylesterase CGR3 isoform X1 [Salvia hispanica]
MAARRPINPSRRISETGAVLSSSSLQSRSRSPSYLSIALILGALFVIGYLYRGQGSFGNPKALNRVEGDVSCTVEVERAIPILKKVYGNSMLKVLHVGPETCFVVSRLIKEEGTEAFGVEPYDVEDADEACKRLVHKGLVRVADIKFPLPYKAKSFPLVIVSDALDYLSPRYLNRSLPALTRLSSDGLVIFTGYPHKQKAMSVNKARYGRSAKLRSSTWWIRYFLQMSLEENEAATKKFEQAAAKSSFTSNCQILHLKSYR